MMKDQVQGDRKWEKDRGREKRRGEVDQREADVLSGLTNFLPWVCHIGDVCLARHCFHLSDSDSSYLLWLIFTGRPKKPKVVILKPLPAPLPRLSENVIWVCTGHRTSFGTCADMCPAATGWKVFSCKDSFQCTATGFGVFIWEAIANLPLSQQAYNHR